MALCSSVVLTRSLSAAIATEITVHLRPGDHCRVIFPLSATESREFRSKTKLPEPISQETVDLVRNGRVRLDWNAKLCEFYPKAIAGGTCCIYKSPVASHALPHSRQPETLLCTIAGDEDAAVLHTKTETPEFLNIFEQGEELDYHHEFSVLLTPSNCSLRFFDRNCRYFSTKTNFNELRDREAILLLKRVFFRLFVSQIYSDSLISLGDATRYGNPIEEKLDFMNELPDLLRINLEIVKEGIDTLANPALFRSSDYRETLKVAYNVLNSLEELCDFASFHSDFYSKNLFLKSLLVEITFQAAGTHPKIAHFDSILQLLATEMQANPRFFLCLLDDIVENLLQIGEWQPVYEELFDGTEKSKGLQILSEETTEIKMKSAFFLAFGRLRESFIPEIRAKVAVKSASNSIPQDDFFFFAQKKMGFAVSLQKLQLTSLQSEVFRSQSRTAFLSPAVILVTGIPTATNPQSKSCVEVNLTTWEITARADLLQERYWHTADFLWGKVIVTGGKSSKNKPSLASVECLTDTEWVAYHPLTTARDSHSSTTHRDTLYVFGGAIDKEKAGTIEKLTQDGHWMLLEVKMKAEVMLAAVGFLDECTAIIAGGRCKSTEKPCFSLNLLTGAIHDYESLPDRQQFVSGMYRSLPSGLFFVFTEKKSLYTFSAQTEDSGWRLLGQF